jgi:ATP-binding cassette subfamily B protein
LADELDVTVGSRILAHAASLDVAFFESPRSQDVIHRAQRDIATHFSNFLVATLTLLTLILQIVSLAVILAFVEPLAFLILSPLALPHLIFQWRTSKRYYSAEHRRTAKRRWSEYFVSLLTDRRYVPEVRVLGLAPHLLNRFRSLMTEFRDENRKRYLIRFRGDSVCAILSTIAAYGLFVRVVRRVLQSMLTVGDVAIFTSAAFRLRDALENAVSTAANAMEETLYISNLQEFLSVQPRIGSGPSRTPHSARGVIEFRNVSFAYPGSDTPALSDVTFRINPGETVALVGKNGAGKTSLVKLLARFYDPQAGVVLFDGIDLREMSLDYLYRSTAFIFQTFGRYEASAFENLAYGDWRRLLNDRGQVERLARCAGVSELIQKMPEGYDTMLGRQFGHYDPSGGQWQQIAIARALARPAALVILDEPTSNLDAEAEYELFSRFRRLTRGRTTILVSHRFATVSMADRILVLDQGRLVEEGAHPDLVAKGGLYAALYEFQRKQMGLSRCTPAMSFASKAPSAS